MDAEKQTRVCYGTLVIFGNSEIFSASVCELPRVVRGIMLSSEDDMIELHHFSDHSEVVYIDRTHIISLIPLWRIE